MNKYLCVLHSLYFLFAVLLFLKNIIGRGHFSLDALSSLIILTVAPFFCCATIYFFLKFSLKKQTHSIYVLQFFLIGSLIVINIIMVFKYGLDVYSKNLLIAAPSVLLAWIFYALIGIIIYAIFLLYRRLKN